MMKDETRRNFIEGIYKGKKALMGVQGLAEEKVEMEKFQSLWGKLEAIDKMISVPTADTVDVANTYNVALRQVNKFIHKLRGITLDEVIEEVEEEEDNELTNPHPMTTIIKNLQAGSQSIMRGYTLATELNPWAEELPVFQELRGIAVRVNEHIKTIRKLRTPIV